MPKTLHDPVELLLSIRPGDKVTIRVPNGIGRNGQEWKEATGRATIVNFLRDPSNQTVVLNMGGPHGTPKVASPKNLVRVGNLKYATDPG